LKKERIVPEDFILYKDELVKAENKAKIWKLVHELTDQQQLILK
jgi:hypothetical protein